MFATALLPTTSTRRLAVRSSAESHAALESEDAERHDQQRAVRQPQVGNDRVGGGHADEPRDGADRRGHPRAEGVRGARGGGAQAQEPHGGDERHGDQPAGVQRPDRGGDHRDGEPHHDGAPARRQQRAADPGGSRCDRSVHRHLAAAARATLVRIPQARHLPPCLPVKTTCAVRLDRNRATLAGLAADERAVGALEPCRHDGTRRPPRSRGGHLAADRARPATTKLSPTFSACCTAPGTVGSGSGGSGVPGSGGGVGVGSDLRGARERRRGERRAGPAWPARSENVVSRCTSR